MTKSLNGHVARNNRLAQLDSKDLVGHEGQEYMVLRTLYMKPDLDQRLRLLAQKQHKSKNQLIREFLAAAVEGAAMSA
jgi:hypothetical protein